MKRGLVMVAATLALVLLLPLLWLYVQTPRLLRQEPDAAKLLALAPEAYLFGEAFTESFQPILRVLSHDGRYQKNLAARGWEKYNQMGAVSFWKAGPRVFFPTIPNPANRLSLDCRKFSLWFEACTAEFYAVNP
ncbi:hypothetical protein Dxin01_00240 [Deinococcus xinjiangensis]|uniref:Uncharacterized protein n=1 Tax=Deinococcus xinjiangensis TaxID=457454 RepID=A0ABP9V5M1_9DEIO